MHRALEVEVVQHRPADQADQQRIAPCRTPEVTTAQLPQGHPRYTAQEKPKGLSHVHCEASGLRMPKAMRPCTATGDATDTACGRNTASLMTPSSLTPTRPRHGSHWGLDHFRPTQP